MLKEVFKTGTHTDSAGNKRTWTGEDLDAIAAKYNPATHEAPVVIGHPKDNSPAFGWVESLERKGGVLYAKLKDLVPEFMDAVKAGLYKKSSISLYPDMTLRHIGFLGAMPPAVKGLKDLAFTEEAGVMSWEFEEEEAEKKPSAFSVQPSALESKIQNPNSKIQNAEFAEVTANLAASEAQRQKAEAELERLQLVMRRNEFEQFLGERIAYGNVTPAQKDVCLSFLEALGAVSNFSEDADSLLTEFKGFLKGLPKQVEFGELAVKGKAGVSMNFEDPQMLASAALEFKAAEEKHGRDISVAQAVQHIANRGGASAG